MTRLATPADAAKICEIYNPYIANSTITFEESPVPATEMAGRIEGVLKSLPWIVAEETDQLVGYAYATPWRARSAYRHSVESTVYLDPRYQRRGYGVALYRDLLARLTALGMHRVIGGIALPNLPSVALHEKLGFCKVAHFEEVGRKFDRWIDVGYWELSL